MRRFLSIFQRNDAFILAVILLLSVTAGRVPRIFDSTYPYPTTLYSILGTICQSLAPLLAAAFFFLLHSRGRGDHDNPYRTDLLKGVLLLGSAILLALALMPFSELIYGGRGARQGIAVGITLFALWGAGQTIFPVVKKLMEAKDEP